MFAYRLFNENCCLLDNQMFSHIVLYELLTVNNTCLSVNCVNLRLWKMEIPLSLVFRVIDFSFTCFYPLCQSVMSDVLVLSWCAILTIYIFCV